MGKAVLQGGGAVRTSFVEDEKTTPLGEIHMLLKIDILYVCECFSCMCITPFA